MAETFLAAFLAAFLGAMLAHLLLWLSRAAYRPGRLLLLHHRWHRLRRAGAALWEIRQVEDRMRELSHRKS
jgi:hypothetical protein